ncbi:hypothetical protein FRC00_013788 [Tulasnella sp. 408]|nr:hypothetical protein FRC00_013788 [Tulasnella sp. 408]
MGDLPTTTVKDLQAMGITPRMVKEAIEKAGKVIHGKVLHFYLPKDNYKHDPNIHRARNYLKSDWELVETRPTVTVKEECSEESFRNFDSEKQSQIHFERSVTITTINEFALTKNFDVSVNANIPLGMGGTLRGFTAVESANEVKSRSTSTDETHKVSIDIDVPAGEGRNVSIRTTQRSTEYVYRALLGVKGTVGIEVDPAWYQRNQYWWIYPAECAFPNASVSREIVKTYIETNVETLIREIYRDKVGDILECRSVVFPRPTSDEALLTETRADNFA